MPLGTDVGLSPGDIVLDGNTAHPSPKGAHGDPAAPALPQFSAYVRCGQMAGWTTMPLGMVVGLGPGDFVLDGHPAHPRKKGTAPTQFSAHVYCSHMAECMKMPLGT